MIIERFLSPDNAKNLEIGVSRIGACYGIEHQWFKLLEECGEYSTQCARTGQALRRGDQEAAEISVGKEFEEAADVFTVLLTILSQMDKQQGELFLTIVGAKVLRQLNRMAEEN